MAYHCFDSRLFILFTSFIVDGICEETSKFLFLRPRLSISWKIIKYAYRPSSFDLVATEYEAESNDCDVYIISAWSSSVDGDGICKQTTKFSFLRPGVFIITSMLVNSTRQQELST